MYATLSTIKIAAFDSNALPSCDRNDSNPKRLGSVAIWLTTEPKSTRLPRLIRGQSCKPFTIGIYDSGVAKQPILLIEYLPCFN